MNAAVVASACPFCSESVPAAGSPGGVAAATAGASSPFNFSIYFMLAGLFSVMALTGRTIIKGIRAADARSLAMAARLAPHQNVSNSQSSALPHG